MIGIDPGLARTGIAVIRREATYCHFVACEVVRTETKAPLAARLAQILEAVSGACTRARPTHAAIERTFVNVNPASSLSLGQARGAALAALGAYGLAVHELAPNMIKRRITGNHLASKRQLATMARRMLVGLDASARLGADATDALAIALSLPQLPGRRAGTVAAPRLRRGRRAIRR